MANYSNLTKVVQYRGSKASIESFSESVEEGVYGYASDTQQFGIYTNGAWVWLGSAAGGSFNGIPVYKDGVFIATGTVIDFEENLYVGATGTTIFVRSPVTTYFRVGQPSTLSNPTGLYWRVPDGVYASGSLGVFINGHALIPGVDYIEWLWVSGIYQYLVAQETGTYHLNHYGVPCSPQTQPPTGTPPVDMTYWLTDSEGELLVDSDGEQLTDSEG